MPISFAAPSAKPGTGTFTSIKAPTVPKAAGIPKGNAGITFGQAPTLKPSVPRASPGVAAQLPVSPGGAPAQAAPAPTGGGTAPASPLDSTYFGNLAANQLKVGGQINTLTATGQNDTTALQSALAALAYQQPRDQLKLEQGANNTGALYSSVYDQNLGNLNNTYLTKQAADTTANSQKQAAINSSIAGLQQGLGTYQLGQYDDAVARATKLAAANPATGQALAPAPITPVVAAARAAVAKALTKAVPVQKKGTAMFTQTSAKAK